MGDPQDVAGTPGGTSAEPVEAAVGGAAPPPAKRRLRDSAAGNVLVIVIATVVILAGVWVVNSLTRGKPQAAGSASPEPSVSQVALTGDTSGTAPKVGEKAPDFTTLTTQGDEVTLATLKGKPAWLVFEATWCTNCRAENPDIQAVHEKYGDDVSVVGIYVGESISTVADYAERLKLTFPQVADSYTDVGSHFAAMGLPTHVFLDADGIVRAIKVGTLTQQQASEQLDPLLGG